MLGKIVNYSDLSLIKDRGNVILVQDTLKQSGRPILKSLIKSLMKLVDEVHIFLFELRDEHMLKGLEEYTSKIHFHKPTSDSLEWKESVSDIDLDLTQMCNNVKIGVVFDSLSRLIMDKTPSYTCRVVNRLANLDKEKPGLEVHSVLGLVHEDLHSPTVLAQIEYISDVTINVQKSTSIKYSGRCSVLVKKPGGKVVKSEELFLVSSSFQLVRADAVSEGGSHESVKIVQEDSSKTDPASNLTFNLRLSEEEKVARSLVQLPYTLDQNRKEVELGIESTAGKIFYQPDDVDDWDEEDPDDDLDV